MSRASRRLVLVAGLVLAVAGPALAAGKAAASKPAAPARDDLYLGSARAPVTVVEYASLGCPHCAAWSNDVFPAFKARYIDTGKVRFGLREMLTGNSTLAAAGFAVARCAGPAKYFQVVDGVFRAQPQMAATGNAYEPLKQVAADAGLDEAAFKACIADQSRIDAIEARERRAEADGVTGTPTFFVAGEKLEGEHDLASLGAAVDKALAAARHRPRRRR
ncbi:MAG TPA: DsbA family protein [Caulobacteraceae bacterium]|nr:DsbA family protein [Caulobacteraceae bacterium]